MSDKTRWRYGDTNPVVAAVDPETVIKLGNLLWQDVDDAKPASVFDAAGFVGETYEDLQEGFTRRFLGVAMQRSRSGDTAPLRVATTGVFEFDCLSGTFELGDLMGVFNGPLKGDDGLPVPKLWDQQVAEVTASKYAIARVAKREGTPVTSVLVDIRSTVMTGGIDGSNPRS